jgi:hypothetical protein
MGATVSLFGHRTSHAVALLGFAVCAALAAPRSLSAQVIEVQVVDSLGGAPVASAIVATQRAEGGPRLRRLTNLRGRAVFEVPGPGRYRILVTGIGYAPTEGDLVTVLARTDSVRRVVRLPTMTITIAALEVRTTDACMGEGVRGIRGDALVGVWEEARKGLDIAVLTEETVRPWIERWTWEGGLDRGRGSLRAVADSVVYTRDPPFVTADPAQLAQEGFARGRDGDWTFYGPDARVLLDEQFLAGHCFGLDQTSRQGEGLAGLHFRPLSTRTVPEIEGTLWLRKGDWTPVELKYTYRNLPEPYDRGPKFGGELKFREVVGIGRIVSEWAIYSPIFATTRDLFSVGKQSGSTTTQEFRGWKLSGGKARALAEGTDLGAPPFQAGSLGGIDSGVGYLRACHATSQSERGLGTVVLKVAQETSRVPAAGVRVRFIVGDADVQQVDVAGRGVRVVRSEAVVTDTTDARGQLAICDVPPGTRYVVQMGATGARPVYGYMTAPLDTLQVLLRAETRGVRAAAGVLRGRVVDSVGAAVLEAQVLVTEVGRIAITDAAGQFRVGGLPEGRFAVVVRRLGYVPVQVFREFRQDTTTVEVQLMPMAVALPELEVRARGPAAVPPRLREWARRREYNVGGRFWDDSLMRQQEHRRLPEVLKLVPGAQIISFMGERYIATTRSTGSKPLIDKRVPEACYLDVYLDGARLSSSYRPANLDDLPVTQITAMELYTSAAQIPVELNTTGSACGVLVVWTRSGDTGQ